MDAAVKAYQSTTQRELRDRLVVEHLDYVQHLLGRMLVGLPQSVDVDNLQSAGILGLVEAANQFDASRGVEFRTFAHHRIRGAILDELRRNCPLPQHLLQRWGVLRRAWEQLGELASTATLAQACGLTETEVDDCIAAVRLTQPEQWSEELGHWQQREADDVSSHLDEAEERRLLADAIEQLPERLRVILSLYYTEQLRLLEIGQVLGLSESRVSRLLSQAEMQLKGILGRVLSRSA